MCAARSLACELISVAALGISQMQVLLQFFRHDAAASTFSLMRTCTFDGLNATIIEQKLYYFKLWANLEPEQQQMVEHERRINPNAQRAADPLHLERIFCIQLANLSSNVEENVAVAVESWPLSACDIMCKYDDYVSDNFRRI